MRGKIKTKREIEAMRQSGQMLATVLSLTLASVHAGVTPRELAAAAERELKKLGGEAAFLGYQGFPAVICASVNDEIVHGIPGDEALKEGDILSLDFGVRYQGMITDCARSIIVGKAQKERHQALVDDTKAALDIGIDQVKNGAKTGDIGSAIQGFLEPKGYGVVQDLVGHGVGHSLHEDPEVPNFGLAGQGATLRSGMTIAIEPMVNLGDKAVYIDRDGWTIKTRDGSLSAHFEDTVLVTDKGYEILTREDRPPAPA